MTFGERIMPYWERSAYLFGLEYIFDSVTYSHSIINQRIKHWRKYGGAPPEGVGAAVGEAAAILRKVNERRGRGGAFMGGGNRSGHFQYNKNRGNRGGDHNNNNNRGGGPRGGPGGGGYGHYRG